MKLSGMMAFLSVLALCGLHALPAMDRSHRPNPAQRYNILKIIRYDTSVAYEVVREAEVALRIQEIWDEFPVWQKAHQLAQAKWNEWYRVPLPEDRGREWILPAPHQPRFQRIGKFDDWFSAEDQADALIREETKKSFKSKKDLYKNLSANAHFLAYESNHAENRKLVHAMLGDARRFIIEQDRKQARALSTSLKKQLWRQIHNIEAGVRTEWARKLAGATDRDGNPLEPDILDVHKECLKRIMPLLKQHRLNIWHWYVIWEEGTLSDWRI